MLDPSEVDRITEVTKVPLMRLVDWKNRTGDPFHLRATPLPGGTFRCEIDLPQPIVVDAAVPLIHGEYEKRDENGTLVYASLPGNTLGQTTTPDGRPTFGVAYDLTTVDAEGRPQLKVYFGTASQWYVKSEYHARWHDLKEARAELEPQKAPPPPPPAFPKREFPKKGARGEGPRGQIGGQGGPAEGEGGAKRRRRGRRGGRGRNRGAAQGGGNSSG